MPTIDAEHHSLELKVIVLGGASRAFLEALSLEDGVLRLGQLQGWSPSLHFYSFSVDPWSAREEAETLEALLPHADGLVLTDALGDGQHYSSQALERLVRALGPGRHQLPTAIFGFAALSAEWGSLAGEPPVFAAEAQPENVMAVVKALAAALLRAKMRSSPPPRA
jgi:hypothetical protein